MTGVQTCALPIYTNQPDHKRLDRRLILPLLHALAHAEVATSPAARPRGEQVNRLLNACQSDLERRFIEHLDTRGHRLPSDANVLLSETATRPDFLYRDRQTAIYIDGPHHAFPERAERDRRQQTALEDSGWNVLRFTHDQAWQPIIDSHPLVFGRGNRGET